MNNEENYKQGETGAFRMGESNSRQITDKDLISKIYKQLMQLNTSKITDPNKKWAKELNRHFSKEDIQIVTHHQRNANQNHSEVPSHAGQNGCHQKVYKQ